jgi:hypothetical protein
MKVFLMHRDRDFRLARPPAHAPALGQDLELSRMLGAMAAGDQFLLEVGENVLQVGLTEPCEIEYRQRILADCLKRADVVRKIYGLALAAIQSERGVYFPRYSVTPGRILSRSVEVLQLLVASLRQLRGLADRHASSFSSEGFGRFFAMLVGELDDDYFETVEESLRELRFPGGPLISARLGSGCKGVEYMLRRAPEQSSLFKRLSRRDRDGYSFEIHPPRAQRLELPTPQSDLRDWIDVRDGECQIGQARRLRSSPRWISAACTSTPATSP